MRRDWRPPSPAMCVRWGEPQPEGYDQQGGNRSVLTRGVRGCVGHSRGNEPGRLRSPSDERERHPGAHCSLVRPCMRQGHTIALLGCSPENATTKLLTRMRRREHRTPLTCALNGHVEREGILGQEAPSLERECASHGFRPSRSYRGASVGRQ